jgi:small ligand-binding sensory domain FIST
MFVTACHHNVLRGLDGRPAVTVLQELYRTAERRDQELFRHSLFLGIGMTGRREEYQRGDFLVRNIIDMDASENTLAIGAGLREGQVVQFQLRDAATSAADVEALLAAYGRRTPPTRVEGALLFSCVGRGKHLYGRPDHDTDAFRRYLPGIPLGGFFCNGEIGPVRGTTFLHGYTSAFGLFRPRD